MQDQNMFDQYAESIEYNHNLYTGIEIHGVRYLNHGSVEDQECFIDDENPQFFSIYARHVEGACLVCADAGMDRIDEIRALAKDLATRYNWDYQDFTFDKPYPVVQDITARRVIACFQSQAWVNDTAMNIDGACDLDVTDRLLTMSLNDIHFLEDDGYPSDELVQGLTGHVGPHYVEVKDSILEFFGVDKLADVTEEMLEQKRLQYAVRLSSERAKLHNVHIYAIVRVKVCDIEAETHADAIQKAGASVDLNALFNKGSGQEFADSIDCFLVDEVGVEDHCSSRWYEKDGVTPVDQNQDIPSLV